MDSPLQVCPEISNPAAAAAAGSDGCHIIRADHYPRRTANLGPRRTPRHGSRRSVGPLSFSTFASTSDSSFAPVLKKSDAALAISSSSLASWLLAAPFLSAARLT